MNETKICPYCRTSISSDAIKCPHCREWLNKKEISFKNPYVQSLFIIVISFGLYQLGHHLIVKRTSKIFKNMESISFTPDKKLHILSSKLIKDEKGYRVIGEIKNDEKYKWDNVELVAIFKDKKNEVLYLSSAYIRDLSPGESRYFQTDSPCSISVNIKDFKDYDLKIETASARP